MDQTDRDTIRRNINDVAKDMDFDAVATFLYSKGIFEEDHIDKFKSKPTEKMRSLELLLAIQRRGPKAFQTLCDSLVETKQCHLAELLRSSSPADDAMSSACSSKISKPNSQPDLPCGNDDPTDVNSIDESEEYKMSSIPRGKCLIINNKTFDEKEPREGTDEDCKKLKKTFDNLGFEVTIEEDLNGMEIETTVEKLSKHDHSALDCVVLVILSHGSEGLICGVDEDDVDIHEMIAMFDADKCPTLIGKPKLFFIQACRGDKKDAGVETSDGIGPAGDGLTDQERDDIEARQILYPPEGDCKATDGKGSKRRKIPTLTDVLLGHCTRPGYVSWRHKTRGSLYIQALTEVFDRCAINRDLGWMMTRVTKRVADKAANHYKQASSYVSSLRKELKFYPKGH